MSHACHYRVTGRVQGVGFRAATQAKAREIGLSGWVRNCADGSVELVARGSTDAVETLAAWLQHGPAAARVDRVEQAAAPDDSDWPMPFAIV